MTVRRSEEESSTGLKQSTGHLNVMVGEVKQELLDAEESVSLGEDAELGHFSDESTDLQLGLNVDLVFLPHMPPKL